MVELKSDYETDCTPDDELLQRIAQKRQEIIAAGLTATILVVGTNVWQQLLRSRYQHYLDQNHLRASWDLGFRGRMLGLLVYEIPHADDVLEVLPYI